MKITTTRSTDPTDPTKSTIRARGVDDAFGEEMEIFNVSITESKVVDDTGTTTTTTTITSSIDYIDELNKILELIR